jgi:hypothetical protein
MPLPIYFLGECDIPLEKAEDVLYTASRHIDSLTFNRILKIGYENLTDFQKEILGEVCKKQALFEYENADFIGSILSSYSINGVSMNLDTNGWNVFVQSGVIMQRDTYEMLKQTGLCCRLW